MDDEEVEPGCLSTKFGHDRKGGVIGRILEERGLSSTRVGGNGTDEKRGLCL